MASSIEETKQDLAELERLLTSTTRPRVRDCLVREIDQLQKEVRALEQKEAAKVKGDAQQANGATVPSVQTGYQENITKYAWDQSDKFMKLYLSLDNLASVADDGIKAQFDERSVTVKVQFPNKTSQLHIAKLCEAIVPNGCYYKKKSDYVLVMLKKSEAGKTWPVVTDREKKSKDIAKPKVDETEDPSANITKMLKNMYDDGDDEMKRSISKAMYESQMKQGGGGDPMGGFGM